MTYKRKVTFLSALVAVLALIYTLILIFDRERRRDYVFAWLDPGLTVMADRIEITGYGGFIALNRRNNIWVFDAGDMEFPVRQSRVEDLFALLSRRAVYPLRATSPEAAERLLLTEDAAHRIVVRGGIGLPLLDLLVGGGDVLGREVFLRMAGRNQIHSGEGDFTFFTSLMPTAWYDLRLFRPFNIDVVQQADIGLPDGEAFTLRRSGAGWVMQGNENVSLDALRVEAWLRSVIEVQGDDFAPNAPEYADGIIILRLGDGSTRVLEAGQISDEGEWLAVVSGSSLVYVLSDWNFDRIFPAISHFIRD